MVADKDGQIQIAYRDLDSFSHRDISLAWSTDGGYHSEKSPRISGDKWMIDGCPHNAPSLCAGKANTYMTWFTGAKEPGLYFARINQDKETEGKIALTSKGRFAHISVSETGDPLVILEENYQVEGQSYHRILLGQIHDDTMITQEVSS